MALLALSLAGCSTSIADLPFGSDGSSGSKDASAYPAIHDMPPPREEAPMPVAEQTKVEQELIAARDHQAPATVAK